MGRQVGHERQARKWTNNNQSNKHGEINGQKMGMWGIKT
jgi:hypothetical protein